MKGTEGVIANPRGMEIRSFRPLTSQPVRVNQPSSPEPTGESRPTDLVSLGPAPEAAPQQRPTNGLKNTADRSARGVLGSVLGALWGAALWATKPIRSVLNTKEFALNFMGDLRRRAEEITENPSGVEAHLKACGMHHEYKEPQNKTNAQLVGKLTIEANLNEYFELWESWIDQGYGSINDRQYGDVVRKYCEKAKDLPLLGYVPVTSVDAFSAVVRDGKMQWMRETTTTKIAGVIPNSTVDWIYRRQDTPTCSNSFERTIDECNGDLEKVQQFYQNLFDPKRVNPDSKARVNFTLEPVELLDGPGPGERAFEHSVKIPMGSLLAKPQTTIGLGAAGLSAGLPGGVGVELGKQHF